jgi:hypothetical protein
MTAKRLAHHRPIKTQITDLLIGYANPDYNNVYLPLATPKASPAINQ